MKATAVLFLAVVIMLGGLYAAIAQPRTSQLFVVGQQYGVVYSCIAQVGCYGELIVVREVRADGWLVVDTDADDRRWYVNPATIISFVPVTQQQAAR